MNHLDKAFGGVSVLFLIIMAVSPAKEHYREWRLYQRQYNTYIQKLPQRIFAVKEELQQIWVPELDVIDRCTTCHLGMTEEALKNAPQPYAAHPPMDHHPERFGCTPCHQGQGLATDVKGSFGHIKFWDQPILSKPFIESSCGTCHDENKVAHAPLLNEGKRLIARYNCAGCHEITGISKEFAPRLDGIGSKVYRQWLVQWITNPFKVSSETRMPNFHLSADEIQVLTDFLMSMTAFPDAEELEPLPEALQGEISETLAARGETLFRQARCISCHLVNGKGGAIASELGTIASKAQLQWIYNFIKNPQKLQPGIPMPQYNFSGKDVDAVTAYIAQEFIDLETAEGDSAAHSPDPNFYDKGIALFKKYNCGGCHALRKIQTPEAFGPALSNVRMKSLYQLDFGKKRTSHTRENYVMEKLRDPRGFLDNAMMPSYQFDDHEITAITTALLSFQERPISPKFRTKGRKEPSHRVQGEIGKLFTKYQCLSCHRINGEGGTIAPDLSNAGSRLRQDWIKAYFKIPYTLRPIMTERMPNFFMSDNEIDMLVHYINMALRDDSAEIHSTFEFSDSQIEDGKKLYYDVYGCQACHQINGEGGYVGPPLDNLSQRLKTGWVYKRLKKTETFGTEVLEPNFNLSDDNALALTSFLLRKWKGPK